MNKCKVSGCENKCRAKGLCSKHYAQKKRCGHILERTIHDPNDIIIHKYYAEVILRDKHCEQVAVVMIDIEDIDIIRQHKWYFADGRVGTNTPKKKGMHQILNPNWVYTDHKDKNPLNNRRDNLRPATHAQNMANAPIDKRNKTGFKGVRIRSRRKNGEKLYQQTGKKYQARITVNKNELHLGFFEKVQDAALVYDDAAVEYFGEFACLNFPREGHQCLT